MSVCDVCDVCDRLCCLVSDAEASTCHRQPGRAVIKKNVGEDVELSCFQDGNVFYIIWYYNGSTVAEYYSNQTIYREQFKGRVYLNPTNFSLTVKNLKLHDSGDFNIIFFTFENEKLQQQPARYLTLQVVGKTLLLVSTELLTYSSL